MWLDDAMLCPQANALVCKADRLHEGQHELARQIREHIAHGEASAMRDAVADLERQGEQLHATLNQLVEGV